MKKVVFLVAVAAGGYFGWTHFMMPEKGACARFADLCEHSDRQIASCEATVKEITKAGGIEQSRRLASCLSDANSCVGGAGCFAGSGIAIIGSTVGDFLKGMGDALKK